MKKASLFTILAVLAMAACSGDRPDPVVPQPVLTSLSDASSAGLIAARDAVVAAPADADRAGRYGMLLQAYQLDDEAAQMYERAIELAPNEHRWHYYLGFVRESQANEDGALTAYREAARLEPGYAPGLLRLANLLGRRQQHQEAGRIYHAALKLDPALLPAAVGVGQSMLALDDPVGARRVFEEVVNRDVSNAQAHYELARLLRASGDIDAAAEQLRLFEQYRVVQPLSPDRLLSEIGQLNTSDQPEMQRARNSLSRGDVAGAIAHFEEAVRRNTDNVGARVALVGLYGAANDFERAEKYYLDALAVAPDNGKLHFNYGFSQQLRGEYASAAESFEHALAINPDDADSLAYLGVSQLELGKRDEARANLERALALNPQQREGNARLGQLLLHDGDLADAVPYLQNATQRDDRYSITYLILLADAQRQLGNDDDAATVRKRALELAQRFNDERAASLADGGS